MRREDVEELSALTDVVDRLHQRTLDRITHGSMISPDSLFSEQSWWNRTVEQVNRKWQLDPRSLAVLEWQLPLLVSAISEAIDQSRSSGGDAGTQLRAAVDAAARIRRAWAAKAKQVAITEVTRRLAEHQLETAKGGWKRWVAKHDDRVRLTHRDAGAGRPIPIQIPFSVGGFQMMFPGDPLGPPQETVGCRCELETMEGPR